MTRPISEFSDFRLHTKLRICLEHRGPINPELEKFIDELDDEIKRREEGKTDKIVKGICQSINEEYDEAFPVAIENIIKFIKHAREYL